MRLPASLETNQRRLSSINTNNNRPLINVQHLRLIPPFSRNEHAPNLIRPFMPRPRRSIQIK